MTSSANGPRRIATIAGLLALVLAVAPTVYGGARSALQVQLVRLDGDRLVISVTNTGDQIAHEKLVFRFALESGVVETSVRVTLRGGETTILELRSPFGGEISPLGVILDDGSPF